MNWRQSSPAGGREGNVKELTPDEIETMRQARQAAAHPLGAAGGYAALAAKWEGQANALNAMGEAMGKLDKTAGQASCMCAEIYQACANELKQHIAPRERRREDEHGNH